MPALQRQLAERGLPIARRQSGTVGVPGVPAPALLPLGATGGTGAAIADLGATVAVVAGRAAEQNARVAEIERKRQENLAQLEREEAEQDFLQFMTATREEARLDPAFDVFLEPENLQAKGEAEAKRLAGSLTPLEQEALEVSTGRMLNVFVGKSRQARLDAQFRRNELALRRGITLNTQGALQATSEAERAMYETNLRATVTNGVSRGFLSAQEGEQVFAVAAQSLLEQEGEIAVEAAVIAGEGSETVQELNARFVAFSRGDVYDAVDRNEAFDNIPVSRLIPLRDLAQQRMEEDQNRVDAREERNGLDSGSLQEANAISVRQDVYRAGTNVGALDAAMARANSLATTRGLTDGSHNSLTGLIRRIRDAAVKAPIIENADRVRDLTISIYGDDLNGAEFRALRQEVEQAIGVSILVGRGQAMLSHLESQRNATYYTNEAVYRENRELLKLGTGLVALTALGPAGAIERARTIEVRTAGALQAYSEAMAGIWEKGGREAVRAQAFTERERIAQEFGVPRSFEDLQLGVPPVYEQAVKEAEARAGGALSPGDMAARIPAFFDRANEIIAEQLATRELTAGQAAARAENLDLFERMSKEGEKAAVASEGVPEPEKIKKQLDAWQRLQKLFGKKRFK